jgi:hypothetical protein
LRRKLFGRVPGFLGGSSQPLLCEPRIFRLVALFLGDVALLLGHVALLLGHVALLLGHVALLLGHVALLIGQVALFFGHLAALRRRRRLLVAAVRIGIVSGVGCVGGH